MDLAFIMWVNLVNYIKSYSNDAKKREFMSFELFQWGKHKETDKKGIRGILILLVVKK